MQRSEDLCLGLSEACCRLRGYAPNLGARRPSLRADEYSKKIVPGVGQTTPDPDGSTSHPPHEMAQKPSAGAQPARPLRSAVFSAPERCYPAERPLKVLDYFYLQDVRLENSGEKAGLLRAVLAWVRIPNRSMVTSADSWV